MCLFLRWMETRPGTLQAPLLDVHLELLSDHVHLREVVAGRLQDGVGTDEVSDGVQLTALQRSLALDLILAHVLLQLATSCFLNRLLHLEQPTRTRHLTASQHKQQE